MEEWRGEWGRVQPGPEQACSWALHLRLEKGKEKGTVPGDGAAP